MKTKNKKKYKNDGPVKKPSVITDAALAHIRSMGDTLCESEGIELVHLEYVREDRGRVLRIYIDKPGGVGINDCTHISRQMGDLLDVYLESDTTYSLEVSSPGPERPLGKASDFEKYSGHLARVKTREPVAGRKKFYGTILGIADGCVRLEENAMIVEIPHKDISQARLVKNNGESKC